MRNRKRLLNRKRVRNLIATFVVTVVVCLALQKSRDHRADAARLARVRATEELLDKSYRVEVGMPFDEALQALHDETGLDLMVKWDVIIKAGVPRKTGVGVVGGNRSLAGVIHMLLQSAGGGVQVPRTSYFNYYNQLDFYIDRQGRVVITTYDDAIQCAGGVRIYDISGVNLPEEDLSRRDRNVRWLLTDSGSLNGAWVEDPQSDNPVGTWCSPRAFLQATRRGKWLVVLETEDSHRRIRRLLQRVHDDPSFLSRIKFHYLHRID
ncbi:MAG: hypothetical protein JWL69_4667 [Phycisphaerales bacterium]|jgi:hypothetical protein|nr:hypothetical protein [Phycisphaerales bacterium]MDB5357900.1 hypothetical protein [Phycisphaerales bacterium]